MSKGYLVAASDAPALIKSRADVVCDGVMDAAIIRDSLANYQCVELSEGHFVIDGPPLEDSSAGENSIIPVPSNRILTGAGFATELKLPDNYPYHAAAILGLSHNTGTAYSRITIADLLIDGNWASHPTTPSRPIIAGIGTFYVDNAAENNDALRSHNVFIRNVAVKNTEKGIDSYLCFNWDISGCYFENCNRGIYCDISKYVTVRGCHAKECGYGFYFDVSWWWTCQGNTTDNCNTGIEVIRRGEGGLIQGNTIHGGTLTPNLPWNRQANIGIKTTGSSTPTDDNPKLWRIEGNTILGPFTHYGIWCAIPEGGEHGSPTTGNVRSNTIRGATLTAIQNDVGSTVTISDNDIG